MRGTGRAESAGACAASGSLFAAHQDHAGAERASPLLSLAQDILFTVGEAAERALLGQLDAEDSAGGASGVAASGGAGALLGAGAAGTAAQPVRSYMYSGIEEAAE